METIKRMNSSKAENSRNDKNRKPIERQAKTVLLSVAKRKCVELPGSCYFVQSRFSSAFSGTEVGKSNFEKCY